jgi:hypothetical protein
MPGALTIDLLKADDVGAKPLQLGLKDIGPLLDCDAGARDQVEVFKVERSNAHRHPPPSVAVELSALLSYRCKGAGAMQRFPLTNGFAQEAETRNFDRRRSLPLC